MNSRKKFYDRQGDRLIVVEREATPAYWDGHWRRQAPSDAELTERLHVKWPNWVVRVTRRYLRNVQGPILEGGCGCGFHVAALTDAGYKTIGIDYAAATVAAVKRARPGLDVRLGDVRRLPFREGFFTGYWSLGVIEHFWEGCEPIVSEMYRVLAPGGMAFVTFPWLSPLRRAVIRRGRYPLFDGGKPDGFYQFILHTRTVRSVLEGCGFDVLSVNHRDARDGIRQETFALAAALERSEKAFSGTRCGRRLWRHITDMLDRSLAWYCGHMALLVARKRTA